MPDDCYAKIGGGLFGPMSAGKLKELAEQGHIKPETPIRRGVSGTWIDASSVKGLQVCFNPGGGSVEASGLKPPVKEASFPQIGLETDSQVRSRRSKSRVPLVCGMVTLTLGGKGAVARLRPAATNNRLLVQSPTRNRTPMNNRG